MSNRLAVFGAVAVCALAALMLSQATAADPPPAPDPDSPKAVADLQKRVARLEQLLKVSEDKRETQDKTIDELKDKAKNAEARLAQIERNDLGGIKRSMATINREIGDLKNRVRRLE